MHAIKTGRLGNALSSGNNKLLIYGINALLLVAIAAHAGLRVQDLFFTEHSVEVPAQPKIEIERPKENFSLLPNWHLFGKADSSAPAASQKEIIAPDTKLALTLRGILARRDKHTGIAIIHDDRGKDEKYFAVGADVFGQATLKEIYADRVILERNGKYETLRLPKEFLLREHFTNKALMAKRKEIATDYRKRFLSRDGMDLIKLFGFDTAYKNGSFIGFVIKALGDEGREMMEVLGVMDGDLITVLNGLRFSESYDAFEEIKKLKTATSVDVIIERDGVEIPFHFELEAPAEGEELDAYRIDDDDEDLSGDDLSQKTDDELIEELEEQTEPAAGSGYSYRQTGTDAPQVEAAAELCGRFCGDAPGDGQDWGHTADQRQFDVDQAKRVTTKNQTKYDDPH